MVRESGKTALDFDSSQNIGLSITEVPTTVKTMAQNITGTERPFSSFHAHMSVVRVGGCVQTFAV